MKSPNKFILREKKIWVAGHNGMVGKAIVEKLKKIKCKVLTEEKKNLNLVDQNLTFDWIKKNKPDVVFIAAAKVGGIMANKKDQTNFLYNNLMIQNNIIKAAAENNVKKLIFLGSSCIYPKVTKQPIKETELLKGYLEDTNEGYAIAKIAGLKLCSYYNKEHNKNFISVMPTNLYGANDNYDLNSSHVMAALISKIVTAKLENKKAIEIWGSGKPKREFLHVNDLADALCFLSENYSSPEPINIGTSKDISILELAKLISKIVDWNGTFVFNKNMPDGTLEKRLDTTKINKLGWKPKIDLVDGLKITIESFKKKL